MAAAAVRCRAYMMFHIIAKYIPARDTRDARGIADDDVLRWRSSGDIFETSSLKYIEQMIGE